MVIEFFWFDKLGLRIEENIHTKAIVDMSSGQGSFGSCSAWKGANDSPGGRKCLPGEPGVAGNYTD